MVRFPVEFSNERYAKGPSCELTSLTGLLSPGYTEENSELFQATVNTSTGVCLERYIYCEALWCLEVYLHAFISLLDADEWSSRRCVVLSPVKEPPAPTREESQWAPQPVCILRRRNKISASVENRTPGFHYIAIFQRAYANIYERLAAISPLSKTKEF